MWINKIKICRYYLGTSKGLQYKSHKGLRDRIFQDKVIEEPTGNSSEICLIILQCAKWQKEARHGDFVN
jgi:hypothetical protein